MGKRDNHIQEISTLFESYSVSELYEPLKEYFVKHSNLPGRRANLELADAFEHVVIDRVSSNDNELWNICLQMTRLSSEDAPTNNPLEFIVFCGVRGLGGIGSVVESYRNQALTYLKEFAKDSRWRVREAVAMALQVLLSTGRQKVPSLLESWIDTNDWLVYRALVAGIAHPRLLKYRELAEWGLKIHKVIVDRILSTSNRRSEQFKTFRKGMGYSLSVIVAALPEQGFTYLSELVRYEDKDIHWILKQNLRKKRLIGPYSDRVKAISEKL